MQTNMVNQSENIGFKICKTAFWENDRCTWISNEYKNENGKFDVFFEPMGIDFYKGLSGVAFFLAALYDATQESLFKKTAIGAIRQALYLQKENTEEENIFSFFRGISGLVYSCLQVQKYCKVTHFSKEVDALFKILNQSDIKESSIDVIEGLGSGVPTLIWLSKKTENKKIQPKILEAGKYLIEIAEKDNQKVSWRTTPHTSQNLTGFSHGTSGLSSALFGVFQYTNQVEFKEMAIKAINYENDFFEKGTNNWIASDNTNNESPKYYYDWAHGSSGIALNRLLAFQICQSEEYKEQAILALENSFSHFSQTPSFGFQDMSVCNGLWGAVDSLIEGAKILNDNSFYEKANILLKVALNQFNNLGNQWSNDTEYSNEVPDFIISLSGIGYTMLRMNENKKYPSILSMFLD